MKNASHTRNRDRSRTDAAKAATLARRGQRRAKSFTQALAFASPEFA